jgi:vitamin B12 transporter
MPPLRRIGSNACLLAGMFPALACAQLSAAPPAATSPTTSMLNQVPSLSNLPPTVVRQQIQGPTLRTPALQDPAAVTIASRTLQAPGNVLGDVSVVTAGPLAHAGQTSLAQLLSLEPGIDYIDFGGPQTATRLLMRGAGGNDTLVLLNGMRIDSNALAAISPDSIRRVEILRGPAGSLYGSGAVGGVVNLITQPDTLKASTAWTNFGVGSRGTTRYSAGVSGIDENGWIYTLAAGRAKSTGVNATRPGNPNYNPDRDGYTQYDFSGSLGYAWRPGQTLQFQYYRSRIYGDYDAGQPWFGDRRTQTLQGYSLTSVNSLADYWKSTLRLGRARNDTLWQNAPGSSFFNTWENQLSWENDFSLARDQTLTLGYEHLYQSASGSFADAATSPASFVGYPGANRTTDAYYLGYVGTFGAHHLQASLRRDRPSGFGGQTTGALSYGYDITPSVRASVTGSTGFRTPTLAELYWPNAGGSYVGNPNLQPERSHNFEASLRYLQGSTEASITYYRNRVSNLIVDQLSDPSNPYSTYMPVNVASATLSGVTLTAAQRFGAATLKASLDLSSPRDNATGQVLPLRTRRMLRLSGEKRFDDGWRVGAEWVLSGKRRQSDGSDVGGYGLINLTAAYDLTSNVELSMRWNNVFNKQYTLVEGYNSPGSSVFFNLGWRM